MFRNSYGIDCQSRRLQNYPSRIGDLQVPEPLNFKMRPITNPFRATSLYLHEDISREFKKRRRRRHGQCRLKMNLYFTYESYESRDTLMPFSLFLTSKTLSKLNMEPGLKLGIEILKISCRSPSPDNAKFGDFTLLFCRGRKEIYKVLKRSCPAFVLLIKLCFLWRSRCRRGFLKLSNIIFIPKALQFPSF